MDDLWKLKAAVEQSPTRLLRLILADAFESCGNVESAAIQRRLAQDPEPKQPCESTNA